MGRLRYDDYRQALNTTAISLYAAKHPRLFFAVGRASVADPQIQSVIQWLNQHYHLITEEVTPNHCFSPTPCLRKRLRIFRA